MPIYKQVNHDFFKTWSPKMAYVLGYVAADGAITIGKRGNHFIDIQSIDLELLKIVQKALGSNHSIVTRRRNPKWQTIYRLQIGSKEIVQDLSKLGITPKKANRLVLPKIPKIYFRDFVRGYFDGDGNIICGSYKRSDRPQGSYLLVRMLFTSCSFNLLSQLQTKLSSYLKIEGHLKKEKSYYRLYYYKQQDVNKLFNFLYGHKPKLYLTRKLVYFRKTLQKIKSGAGSSARLERSPVTR